MLMRSRLAAADGVFHVRFGEIEFKPEFKIEFKPEKSPIYYTSCFIFTSYL